MAKRVLAVDDEKCIADTLAAILNNYGYEAVPFYDAESALAECEVRIPDLVISDVVMPGMNGVDMAVVIKQRHPSCKILLFSGQSTTANILEEGRTRGYDFELLSKPIHPTDLLAKLDDRRPPLPASNSSDMERQRA
jgi:DNA-binding NtrC family response regulator